MHQRVKMVIVDVPVIVLDHANQDAKPHVIQTVIHHVKQDVIIHVKGLALEVVMLGKIF